MEVSEAPVRALSEDDAVRLLQRGPRSLSIRKLRAQLFEVRLAVVAGVDAHELLQAPPLFVSLTAMHPSAAGARYAPSPVPRMISA